MSLRRARVYTAPIPKMPVGLIELMEGLAKDVLKNNPENIYEFCSQHMQKLLFIRDGDANRKVLTLSQKVVRAQEKVRQRAELRRKQYDKEINLLKANNDHENLNESEIEMFKSDNGYEDGNKSETTLVKAIDHSENPNKIDIELLKDKANEENHNIRESELLKSNTDQINHDKTEMKFLEVNDKPENLNETEIEFHKASDVKENRDNSEIELLKADDSHENRQKEIANDEISFKCDEISEGDNLVVIEPSNLIIDENLEDKSSIDKQESFTSTNSLEKTKNGLNSQNEVANIPTVENIKLKEEENIELDQDEVLNTCSLTQSCESEMLFENNAESKGLTKSCSLTQSCDQINQNQNNDMQLENETGENDTNEGGIKEACNNDVTEEVELQTMPDSKTNDIDVIENENCKSDERPAADANDNTECNSEIFSSSMSDLNHEDSLREKESDNEIPTTFQHTMDLETAAITIQKVFRSFLFRSKTSSVDEATNVDINSLISCSNNEESQLDNNNVSKERRTLGLSRMDTVLQTVNEEKSLSLSTDDSSTLSSAATIIQAHVRGFLVRNKLNLNKTASNASIVDSDAQFGNSLDKDLTNPKNKTILNIHIVPEGEHFISRDESIMTSYDMSLDGSPPHSTNLHPLGYDKNERRKQLKREDAIQSVSPPSNNSGKSEDVDSVKEVCVEHNDNFIDTAARVVNAEDTDNKESIEDSTNIDVSNQKVHEEHADVNKKGSQENGCPKQISLDEMDVVGPFNTTESNKPQLMHSSEFHDIALPTMVSRSNNSVVREFQNVLVYFLFWNNS